jgi:uncharacterized protein (TIGR03435 family)
VAPGEATPSAEQVRLMLQTLLADRFQLKLHRESRELSVYDLVEGKSGPKIKKMPANAPWPPSPGYPQNRLLMEQICTKISRSLDRPLLDKTGFTGTFEYTDWGQRDLEESSIFTLVQELLGLKLEPAKEQVEIIVIDHAEKPSAN